MCPRYINPFTTPGVDSKLKIVYTETDLHFVGRSLPPFDFKLK